LKITSFILSFLLLSLNTLAQEIELSVQTGHSSSINCIAFSPGDDLIASGGTDKKIILWDFISSKQADVFLGHNGPVTGLIFHPNEKLVFSTSLDSTVKIWEIQTGNCIQTISFKFQVNAISIHPNGKEFVIAGKEIVLLSYPDFTRKSLPIRAKKEFTTVAYNSNGTYLGIGGKQEDLAYAINLEEKSIAKKIAASVTDLSFDSSSGNLIYTTSQGIGAEIEITSKAKKSISTDWMLNSYNALANTNEQLFFANDLGEIRIIDRINFQEKNILKTKRSRINCIKISHNQNYLASAGDEGRIVIWDLNTLRSSKEFKGSVSQINDLEFSNDGNEILIGYQDGSLRKTNLFSNQSLINSPQPESEIISSRFTWSVYEIIKFEQDSAVLTMHRKRYSFDEESAFDKIVEFTVIWYFEDNYLKLIESKSLEKEAFNYMQDRKKGISHSADFLLKKELTVDTAKDHSLNVSISASSIRMLRGKSLNPLEFNAQHSDRITSLAINENYGFIASAGWDGLIRFWDSESGKLLTTFGPFSGGQFIYISPEGYYFSSKKALDYVGFRLDQKLYSFEQFDLIYNRPDLVAEYLPYYDAFYVTAYKKAYLKRLAKLGLTEGDLKTDQAVPVISYKRNIDKLLLTGKMNLHVTCKDPLHELDKLHIRVNGVPEYGRFGKEISGHYFQDSIEIELNPGTNYIQVFCTNSNGISSLQESFTVEAHKKDEETDLYIVSIGVSEYLQNQYNLSYARKDAEDMDRFFSRPFGIFSTVHTKLLVDSSVTISNIYNLKGFLEQPKPNDVVLFFVAGHGVLDLKFDYYLATYDMDFKNPSEKGIPYELFEELLDNTKSRKKVMFLDACHSGEIDKEEVIKSEIIESEQGDIKFRSAGINIVNKEETNSLDLAKSLFADMRLNNGTTVISSAGGTEFAIESENWRNGAFTYCLLYGLSSGDADINQNKIITLSELQEYLLFQVNKLTNGAQTPTSRVENLNTDFRIK
jgi:WD40 repeat protein